ncbi:MAG: hypothetical protein LCH85_22135 [Chloroflexi bacterium]|nr:hypothetical protein [Chloroflexota bacterium]
MTELPKQVKIHESGRQLMTIMNLLLEDVDYCFLAIDDLKKRGYSSEELQFWYRAVIRSLFAWIEGVIYRLKQFSIEYDGVLSEKLDSKLYSSLLDTEYQINEKGEIVKSDKFIPLPRNLIFAFKIYAHVYNCQYNVETSTHHWRNFRDAIKIRNRITHPKVSDDITITEDEVLLIKDVRKWFSTIYQELYNKTQAENDRFIAEKEREVEELKNNILDSIKQRNNGQIRRKDT